MALTGQTNTDRRFGISSGVAVKAACVVASTTSLTLSSTQVIDGIAVGNGERVVVKDQVDAKENGIYISSGSTWLRDSDFDGRRDAIPGTFLYVDRGTTYGDTFWAINSSSTDRSTISIGTEDVNFSNITPTLTDTSGGMVTATGSTVARRLDDRFAESKNVLDYGAVNDGDSTSPTNNTPAFQRTVDAGDDIYVPNGSFRLETAGTFTGYQSQTFNHAVLSTEDNKRIWGSGKIRIDTSSSVPCVAFAFDGAKNCVVEGLQFEGDGTHPAVFSPIGHGAPVYFNNGVGNVARSLRIDRMGDGVVIADEQNSNIENCISNIPREDKTRHHFFIFGSEYCSIRNCEGYGFGTDGNVGVFGTGRFNKIQSCVTTKSAIEDDSFAGNKNTQGILVDSGQSGAIVQNNVVRGGFWGISVKSNSDTFRVSNNNCSGCFIGIAVWEGEGAQNNPGGMIDGNTILINGANDDSTKPSFDPEIQQGVGIYISDSLLPVYIRNNYIGDDYSYSMGIVGDGASTSFLFKHSSDRFNIDGIEKNGVSLSTGTDYTVSGNEISFTTAPTSTDIVKIDVAGCTLDWCGIHVRGETSGIAVDQEHIVSISNNSIEMSRNFAGTVQRSHGHALWAKRIAGTDPVGGISLEGNHFKDAFKSTDYSYNNSMIFVEDFLNVKIDNNQYTGSMEGSAFRLSGCYYINFSNNTGGVNTFLSAERSDADRASAIVSNNMSRPVGSTQDIFKFTAIRNVTVIGNSYPNSGGNEGKMVVLDNSTSSSTNARLSLVGNIFNPIGQGAGAYYSVNGVDNSTSTGDEFVTLAGNIISTSTL